MKAKRAYYTDGTGIYHYSDVFKLKARWTVYKDKIDKYAVGDVIKFLTMSEIYQVVNICKEDIKCDSCSGELDRREIYPIDGPCQYECNKCFTIYLNELTNLEYLEVLSSKKSC